MCCGRLPPSLLVMAEKPTTQRVEVTFVGPTPARQVERASGVSEVEVHGPAVRCIVFSHFWRHSMVTRWSASNQFPSGELGFGGQLPDTKCHTRDHSARPYLASKTGGG